MTQEEFKKEWNNDSDFIVCHTSGSTGVPKEIHLNKDFMRQSARRTNQFFGIDAASRLHTCLDFRYIASKMMVVRSEEAGCELTSELPSNRPLQQIADDEKITLLSVVPSQMQWILDNGCRWRGVENYLIGGAPIPSLSRRRIALSGINAWESYGMTETASHIALRRVEEDDTVPFRPLEGVEVSVDEQGCLVIEMPGLGKVTTTDLAEMTPDAGFRILGRADNCVISGGVKIIPEKLEAILGPFIAFDYCISSLPDPKWGERLVLVVRKGDADVSDDLLKNAVAVRLGQFKKSLDLGVKAPKEIIVVGEFPLTQNGKLDRKSLKLLISK